jgi:ABC-type transport system involved in multi-copper enzyme maturation permease subunit
VTIAVPTTTIRPAATGAAPGRQAGFRQAVRGEWTKLATLRSTKWTLAVAAAGALLVTFLSAHGASNHSRGWYQGFDPTNQSLAGLAVVILAFGVLGALAVTGEYGTGTIRSSLAAMPRRDTLLAAKVTVVGLLTLVVGEILSFGTFFFGQVLLSAGHAPTAALDQAGVLRAVALSGASLALFALLGLGLGTIIRNTAGGISAFAAVTLLPALLLSRISENLTRFGPANMFANSIAAVVPNPNTFSPTVSFLLLGGYVVAALGLGAAVLMQRDA